MIIRATLITREGQELRLNNELRPVPDDREVEENILGMTRELVRQSHERRRAIGAIMIELKDR